MSAGQLPRDRLSREMQIALDGFMAANREILTPADYFVAGVEFFINQCAQDDTELLDWLEEQARCSPTGISFDWAKHVEDGEVFEKGYRFMRRHFLGKREANLREAIRAARAIAE